jgi:hypothetical protein
MYTDGLVDQDVSTNALFWFPSQRGNYRTTPLLNLMHHPPHFIITQASGPW